MAYRILAGGCVRQQPEVLESCLELLKQQKTPDSVSVDWLWIDDNEDAESSNLLHSFGDVMQALPRSSEARYSVGPQTHQWSDATFERLARHKQWMLDRTLEEHYDACWLVDSDLLLDKHSLASLSSCSRPVVNAVFWTRWQQNSQSVGPNVWLQHPYGQDGRGMATHEFWGKLVKREICRVAGGGACVLIRREAIEAGARYHPRLDLPQGQMWRGEDRSFAIRCERAHIQQWADPWPDIFHAYHPAQRTPEVLADWREYFAAPSQEFAKYGDQVAFTVEALEDPAFAGEVLPVRGRLGGIRCLPEIEAAVADMKPGEEQITQVSFPAWYPLNAINRPGQPPTQYRGTTKTMRVKMIDVRPYGFAPLVADEALRGLEEAG